MRGSSRREGPAGVVRGAAAVVSGIRRNRKHVDAAAERADRRGRHRRHLRRRPEHGHDARLVPKSVGAERSSLVARRNPARGLRRSRATSSRRLHDEAGRVRADARPRECVFAVVVTRREAARRRARGQPEDETATSSRSSTLMEAECARSICGTTEAPMIADVPPEWSPDGKLIAFVDDGGQHQVREPGRRRRPRSLWRRPLSAAALVVAGFDEARFRPLRRRRWRTLGASCSISRPARRRSCRASSTARESPTWSPEGDQLAFLSLSKSVDEHGTTSHSCGGEPRLAPLGDGTGRHEGPQARRGRVLRAAELGSRGRDRGGPAGGHRARAAAASGPARGHRSRATAASGTGTRAKMPLPTSRSPSP